MLDEEYIQKERKHKKRKKQMPARNPINTILSDEINQTAQR